jgi:hypothetical protein
MKRTIRLIVLAAMIVAATAGIGASESLYGNGAAKADADLSIEDMLLYAAQDEYFARGEYLAIMAKFGEARPFTNIERAEENHLAWLRTAYGTYRLSFPADGSKPYIAVPATLKDAFSAGVQAEIDNIAMYDRFLASSLLRDSRYADLKNLFTNLKNASGNHLESFRRQAAKY